MISLLEQELYILKLMLNFLKILDIKINYMTKQQRHAFYKKLLELVCADENTELGNPY